MSGGGQVAVVDFLGIETGGQVYDDNNMKNSKPDFNLFSKYFRENGRNVDSAVTEESKRHLELSNGKGNIMPYATARTKAQPQMDEDKRTIQPINVNLDLSCCPARNPMELFSRDDQHKLGFGSPIPISGTELQCKSSNPANSEHDQDNIVPKTARQPHQWPYYAQSAVGSIRCPASMTPGKQLGAQLTIFYAGTVNVYDAVPADKAQAIMLLADSGFADSNKYCNSNFKNTAFIPSCTSGIPSSNNSMGAMSKTMSSQNTSGQTVAAKPLPTISFSGGDQNQKPPTRKLQADLPLARKHSLQRFLEKRKDRLNGGTKNPYSVAESSQVSDHASRYPPSFHLSCNETTEHSSPSHCK